VSEVNHKDTKAQSNVPSLRFSEFDGEWKNRRMDDFINFCAGYAFKSKHMTSSGKYQLIKMSNVYKNQLRLDRNPSYWNVLGNNQQHYLLERGDLVLTLTGTIGKRDYGYSALIPADSTYLLNQRLVRLRAKERESVSFFVKSLVSTDRFYYSFFANSKGGTGNQSNVSVEDLKSLRLPVPELHEMRKIADFLTAVDKRIAQLEEKKRLLTEYKKDVMQQIFSQQIRFTDDNSNPYPDWEEKRLGDVVSLKMTNSLSRSALNYKSGLVFNIHYGDIHTKFKSNFHIGKENVPYINDDIDLSKIADDYYCQVGDLIIADASEDYKDIGKAIEIIETDSKQLLAGLHTYLARPEDDKVAVGFLGYLMQARYVRLQMMRFAQGISVLGISKGNVAKVVVQMPTVEEQQKIADFLTSIDTKIEQVAAQLEQAKTFKKGLLQQMFV